MLSLALLMMLQTTDTTCEPVFGQMRCTSRTRNDQAAGPIDYTAQQRPIDFSRLQAGLAARRARQAEKPSKRAKKAGKMVAAGRCEEAEAFALGEGDFDLARQVKSLCPS